MNNNNQSRSSNRGVVRWWSISGRGRNEGKKELSALGKKKTVKSVLRRNFLGGIFGLKFQTMTLWNTPMAMVWKKILIQSPTSDDDFVSCTYIGKASTSFIVTDPKPPTN